MKTLRRIALALAVIGAINWGLVGLFQFDLVGTLFGGTASGFARFVYMLVGIAGVVCIGMLFNADTVDAPAREEHRGFAEPNFATEFAEEPDLDMFYNPSKEAYDHMDAEEEELQ